MLTASSLAAGYSRAAIPKSALELLSKPVTHISDADILADVSRNLGEAMVGINVTPEEVILGKRGW